MNMRQELFKIVLTGYDVSMREQPHLLSIIVPGHNEAENLVVLIPRLKRALDTLSQEYEVIIVDNASKDATEEVVSRFSEEMPQLRLTKEPTLGYGRAVLAGLSTSRGDVIGIIRADNQEKPEDLCHMVRALQDEHKTLYKAIRMHRKSDGLKRVVISFVYNALFKFLFGLASRDLNATPKVFTRAFFEAAHLESKDWFIDAEMIIKAEHMKVPIGEMEIEYLPRLKGRSSVRMRHIFEFFGNMLWWWERERHGHLLEK